MKPLLLVLIPMPRASIEVASDRFELVDGREPGRRATAIATHGAALQAVLTNGTTGFTADEIDACPKLKLVCVLGAGYENVAIAHAHARGVVVANGAGTNDDCVADHAMALLLAAVRAVPTLDRACRAGVWRTALPVQPNVSHKRLGLVGFGAIGRKIARRGAGFEMAIGFHTRTRREAPPHRWFDSVVALAEWADFLVVATPGGAATTHLIDASVLAALGPEGYLVNIARRSVVDTVALAEALRTGRIRGAGLDVYESEPAPPAELIGLDNVVLTPHVAGTSPEAMHATFTRFLENATRHFAGQPVVSPVLPPVDMASP